MTTMLAATVGRPQANSRFLRLVMATQKRQLVTFGSGSFGCKLKKGLA